MLFYDNITNRYNITNVRINNLDYLTKLSKKFLAITVNHKRDMRQQTAGGQSIKLHKSITSVTIMSTMQRNHPPVVTVSMVARGSMPTARPRKFLCICGMVDKFQFFFNFSIFQNFQFFFQFFFFPWQISILMMAFCFEQFKRRLDNLHGVFIPS